MSDLKSDATYIEAEMVKIGKPELGAAFEELTMVRRVDSTTPASCLDWPLMLVCNFAYHQTITVILSDSVRSYISQPSFRKSSSIVKPKRLAVILNKLARQGLAAGPNGGKPYERAQQRRAESDAVRRLGQP